MLDFCIYLLYRAGTAIASVLPVRVLFALGSFFGLGAWLLLPQYRRLALRNLEIAFGNEKSSRELRVIARRNFQCLSANMLCNLKMISMPAEKLTRYVESENLDAVHQELRAGRPVVLVLSHIGSWELAAQLVPHYAPYRRIGSPYQSLRNRYVDRDVSRRRARTGAELFDRSEGFQKPIELLRAGGLLGVFADQHAGDHGVWTPLFGRLASTSALPGLLAKRTGATVMAAAVHTVGPARWRMIFTPRLDSPGDSVNSITWKANATIEQQIRKAP
jgi:heptosyltransferase-2